MLEKYIIFFYQIDNMNLVMMKVYSKLLRRIKENYRYQFTFTKRRVFHDGFELTLWLQ